MDKKLDFKSLEEKGQLNPDIWTEDKKLRPEVRKRLIQLALRFYKDLEINWAQLKDINFTGSLANYNWSKYSDIDLHLIVDFKEIDERVGLVENYLKAKKSLWNDRHDITIHGAEVEVYVQDEAQPHYSSGIYSIMFDEWKVEPKEPTLDSKEFDRDAIKKKVKDLNKMADEITRMAEAADSKEDRLHILKLIDRLQDKIKNMRQCGLEKTGEFSTENLTFKLLRREGYLEKLQNTELKTFDSLMSI